MLRAFRAMLLLLVAGAAALRAPSGLRCPRVTGATVLRSSTTEIMMPALSSTMTSGRVVSWLKNVGDKIEAGDPIIVVESDKADMEVESYDEGARRRPSRDARARATGRPTSFPTTRS